jgi:surface polysaccharide O-acyltransferase-like enzyme
MWHVNTKNKTEKHNRIFNYSIFISCFEDNLVNLASWWSWNALDLYHRGTRFKTRLFYRLILTDISRLIQVTPDLMLELYLKTEKQSYF